MIAYSIDVKRADLDVIVLTNIGVYTESVSADGGTVTFCTDDKRVFDGWVQQLRAAGRTVSASRN